MDLVIIHYDLLNILDKNPFFIESIDEKQFESIFNSISHEMELILTNLKSVPAIVFNTFSAMGIYANAVIQTKGEKLALRLNEYLKSKKNTNLQLIDINVILTKVGVANAFDFRMFYLSKSLYTIAFWKEYVYSLSSIVYRFTGILKKAVLFDCDNTLWKGVLGEDGMTGIDMSSESKVGQIYNNIQKIAVWLSNQGVIIGLCSKNNPGDVELVFKEHPDMVLSKDHIVISRINWQDKATNLREIAKELNIGLDSLVFVDDSSFEINLIKEQIPQILTLQVPASIHEYPNELLRLIESHFYLAGNKEDIEKTKQYKAQTQRNIEMNKHQSLVDYLSNIGIELTIKENDSSQIPRISQITQKTNQFNLTTKRYTEKQIEDFINDKKTNVISVSVKDKFGESGLTAVIIAKEDNNQVEIDSFIMSCRIMGRNIELAIMNYFVKIYKDRGYEIINATYLPTIKNKPVSNFYEESGFTIEKKEHGIKRCKLKVGNYKSHKVYYIKIN
ncbi:HAD-IIIC family phosphatase [Bacteroidota bacterium]